jgi:ArsR family transcriptional regulator
VIPPALFITRRPVSDAWILDPSRRIPHPFYFRIVMPTKELTARAEWLAALGEPTRLSIVHALVIDPMTVTQLAATLQVEMVNISHHLRLMREAGLVEGEKDGRFVINRLVGAKVARDVLELTHPSGAKVLLPLH